VKRIPAAFRLGTPEHEDATIGAANTEEEVFRGPPSLEDGGDFDHSAAGAHTARRLVAPIPRVALDLDRSRVGALIPAQLFFLVITWQAVTSCSTSLPWHSGHSMALCSIPRHASRERLLPPALELVMGMPSSWQPSIPAGLASARVRPAV
jgi:hypothetical protein